MLLHVCYTKNEMSNEYKTIHEFDFNLICEFYSNMERQGPGSPDVTLKALSFIDSLTDKSLIADIGCGTGDQTLLQAKSMKQSYTTSIKNFTAIHFSSQKR
ncbi:hypothetical protein SDC9_91375 [bioreactor metagenome]|uniref:Methyltransferase domain-containing protein n=1 Tax=bioreactor metagenome TaxID=1076179 RepID=A0A645A4J4_9ZZZZ